MHNPFPRPVCLVGPTASGKTAAALALAQAYPVEIISVDSALVYRGMDIGTAKPTAQEQAQVKHHLLDIRDPAQSYSAAEFARDARVLIEQIQARGALPLLVGGTMLYYKALFEGLDEIPAAQPELRAELEAQAQSQGWPAMHAQLAQVDPATAQRLSPNDAQRIQRALEVYRSSGQPLSSYFTSKTPVQDQALWVALVPQQRSWLHERIALRLTQMFAQGFVDEVQALRARGDLSLQLPSMRCVGYRQVWEALDGAYPLDQAQEKALFATRQLAKRQLTWLRGMTMQHTLACDDPAILSQLMTLIQREQA